MRPGGEGDVASSSPGQDTALDGAEVRARRGRRALNIRRGIMWIRSLVVALSLSSAGCDDVFTAGGVATATPVFTSITAGDLRDLDRDESVLVELDGEYPVVFEFDGRRGALDFGRIEIATPAGGRLPLGAWLEALVSAHGLGFVALSGGRFRLANDRAAASLGIVDSQPGSCDSIDIVDLDGVVAVLFVAEASC
ncbi:hypothetical protein [Nannocystis punicea]|uniref:Uncharacterized protein n=1 Tax=Nannocystis punicea TaxID=2995304 RepID=A0ABY7HB57_9BACT|nr:hypothetical protein [Nannocystis poenicansa]WAS96510.1 hypothetical protein O0S08_10165 [Nannocystis poenicansa]